MAIKAHDTFWQRRKIRGLQPILLEVIKVEEIIGTHAICKVRWHILGKDAPSKSVFPMATITDNHFADFVPIQRAAYLKALGILNDTTLDYHKRKHRILYLMRDLKFTDDE